MLSARPVSSRDRIVGVLDQLPAFSPIINRLLASLVREHVSFAELAQLVEKDTVLAGNLLRIVNSALYGYDGAINSVPHAISILGLNKLRNTVLALSLARMWQQAPVAKGWSGAEFNLHSAATAAMSDLLVQYLPAAYPEGAFTAGLFHDVGKLLMATALPAEYEAVCSLVARGEDDLAACEKELAGVTHAELSALALAHWNLPLSLQWAVKNHHEPEHPHDRPHPLSRIVQAADRCVNAMGIRVPPVTFPSDAMPEQALEALGLQDQIPPLLDEFETELAILRTFF